MSRPQLLMLPGWGMTAAVLRSLSGKLATDFSVTVLDLPGQGRAGAASWDDCQALTEQWLEQYPGAHWLGWSLGGQLALQVAIAARRVAAQPPGSVVLLGTSPTFLARPHWPWAMAPAEFAGFRRHCEQSPDRARKQFLALVAQGGNSRRVQRSLQDLVPAESWPEASALRAGLDQLENLDLVTDMTEIEVPVLWLMGQYDALVSARNGAEAARRMHNARAVVLPDAGHAPFLDNEALLLEQLDTFYAPLLFSALNA